jgi:hypothetical protein
MKTEEFTEKHLPEIFARLLELSNTKGVEYRRTEGNVFANFDRLAEMLGLRHDQVLAVYLTKHIDAIMHEIATAGEQKYSEPVTGRIEDALLYLCLLHAMKSREAARDASETHSDDIRTIQLLGGGKLTYRESDYQNPVNRTARG